MIETIQAQAAGGEVKLAAAFRLDPRSQLTKDIRLATANEIEANDIDGLVAFVKGDLAGEPYLTLVKDGVSGVKIALLGNQMTYWLSPYRAPETTDLPTFEFAVCEKAELARPHSILGSEVLLPEMLDILPTGKVQEQSFARRRGRVAHWQPHIDALKPAEQRKTDLDRKYEAFALLTALEMAYAVADIFPVSVQPGRPSEGAITAWSPRRGTTKRGRRYRRRSFSAHRPQCAFPNCSIRAKRPTRATMVGHWPRRDRWANETSKTIGGTLVLIRQNKGRPSGSKAPLRRVSAMKHF